MNKRNRNDIYSSVTTFNKDTDDCNLINLGAFSDSTDRLHSVSVHDVLKVTRKTKHLSGTKVVTITIHTANGNIDINAFE